MRCGALTVDFVGETIDLTPNRVFTFGRCGDLQLDTSADLPGVVGVFSFENDIWWLGNKSAAVDIHLLDRDSRSAVLIAAQSSAPIPYERSLVRLSVGPMTYEVMLRCTEATDWRHTVTKRAGQPSLNGEQRQLLTALAEGALRGTDPHLLPSNAEAAERLGWRITKLNRKLDHLCIKFDKLGVAGLRGTARRLATERRRLLVDHALATGLITVDDLDLSTSCDAHEVAGS